MDMKDIYFVKLFYCMECCAFNSRSSRHLSVLDSDREISKGGGGGGKG